jgi:3'-5' exoribonuclease
MKRNSIRIADIGEGEEFVGFYVVRRATLKETDGSCRLEIELADKTGSVPGVIWEDAKSYQDKIAKGVVVKVQGHLGSYRDKPQARIDKIRPAKVDEYEPDSFIPSIEGDADALAARVAEYVERMDDPFLKQLGKAVFGNATFMKEFRRSPGGSSWHHCSLGGLLEHSVSVADICDFIASRNYGLNRDLLVLAALLHDVGKLRELSSTTMIDYTDEGRLEGHVVMGDRFVRAMCDRIADFPPKLRTFLSHLMLSHHGRREFSSPVEPMIPEAFALYYADEIDAKLDALKRVINDTSSEGKSWSDFNRILNRYLYAGDRTSWSDDTPK